MPHAREASGTSWQPDATPMHGAHFSNDDWEGMMHGLFFGGYDHQNGRRGASSWTAPNWFMLMAQRPVHEGRLGLRAMMTLEPFSVGRRGYPLLLQSGEAVDGRPVHDRQHPHDLFMELAATYSAPISKDLGWQLYAAPVGEPALGPVAFPHRLSASSDPLAPLGHHWQDSTHISFGVLTAGILSYRTKLETSWFNGREPDENRTNFDFRNMDSFSSRLTFNPDRRWSTQVSYGRLDSPEELEPEISIHRLTASASHIRPWGTTGHMAATFGTGVNIPSQGRTSPSFLIETNWDLDGQNVIFGRAEYVAKSGHDLALKTGSRIFSVGSLVTGYLRLLPIVSGLEPGLGARFSINFIESALRPEYGRQLPYGFMIFVRLTAASKSKHGHAK